jgi:mRNA-degrading endonuclease RelE of RelBE toxin-antitoxin system
MAEYTISYGFGWDKNLRDFDKGVQQRISKKIKQLKSESSSRHLRYGLPFFVEQVGGYRIVFETNEEQRKKTILFIGSHKQYEKWYSSF